MHGGRKNASQTKEKKKIQTGDGRVSILPFTSGLDHDNLIPLVVPSVFNIPGCQPLRSKTFGLKTAPLSGGSGRYGSENIRIDRSISVKMSPAGPPVRL